MQQFNVDTRVNFFRIADGTIREVAHLAGEEHAQKGGYFRLFYLPPNGWYYDMIELSSLWLGGGSNKDKLSKYELVSMEKAIRLAQRTESHADISSWQSRAPQHGLYGGAVRLACKVDEIGAEPSQLIFSFSGLPEEADEAAMTMTARRMKSWRVSSVFIDPIIKISNNAILRQMFAPVGA